MLYISARTFCTAFGKPVSHQGAQRDTERPQLSKNVLINPEHCPRSQNLPERPQITQGQAHHRVSPNHPSTSPNQPKITPRSLSPPLTLATSITFVTLVTSIRQTWHLSKILHRRIFRLKILHRQFQLISAVLVRKNTKNE